MGLKADNPKLNPYVGLRPFLPEESDLFFGREGESEEVLKKLLKNRFVTVMGASGTGKSSLIYCGVLPRIEKLSEEGAAGWKVITFRPGNDPIGNLTEALINFVGDETSRNSLKESVSNLLRVNPGSLSTLIKDMVIRNNEKVLLLVDQFEELFRYTIKGTGAVASENASSFVSQLEHAVAQTDTEIYSIITMRSDFIGECAHFQGLTQLINDSNYLVPHMGRENYRSAIEGPVKYAGAGIDPKLVDTLLNDIGDQTDQLPVLQHALMRTWSYWQELDDPDRPISVTDYDSVGTMRDAMSRHANEAFDELGTEGREICEKTFKAITEKGADNKGIRHPMSVRSIKTIIGCTSEALFEVIEKFRVSSRSFITPREGVSLDDDSIIDLSHESLMRLWDRLKEWVDEEAASVQMYLRLSEASAMYQQGKTTLWRPPDLQLAINWREQQKPTLAWAERYDPAFERAMVYLRTSEKEYLAEEENKIRLQKRQMKRTRIVAMILGGAAIISVGFMLFAFVQKIAADKASNRAEENARLESIQRHKADSAAEVAERNRALADSSAQVALENAELATAQRNIADYQRSQAEINAERAREQEQVAREQSDSAMRASIRAENNRIEAEKQRIEALRNRMLSVGKTLSIKSLQVQGQKDLQSLLAYQAYLFNSRNGGLENDADIYQGLYTVDKTYFKENYKTFPGHSGIRSIAFIPGKNEFFASGYDGKVSWWNLNDSVQNIQVIYTSTEIIEVLAVSPDKKWLACGGDNSIIKMIPIEDNNSAQYELRGHSGKIKSLIFSFDGKYLYSASLDGKVLKWDLVAKTSVNFTADNFRITSIDCSSNGNSIAGVSSDGKAIIWNPEKTAENFSLPTGNRILKVVRFWPGENKLAVGYTDGYLELWDISTRQKTAELQAHTAEINDIRFNNLLHQMATASNDGTLKIWDTEDLTTPPISFNDNGGFVMVIEFSPDGNEILSGTYENTDNLVARPTNANLLAKDMCSRLTRNMTEIEWATYVPRDVPYEKTCEDKEFSIKANPINIRRNENP